MKFADPFNRSDLRVRKRLECIEVGFFCKSSTYWYWKTLTAKRWSTKALAEAKAVALELMRESAERWNACANAAFSKQRAMLTECTLLEQGLKGWSDVEAE